MHEIVLKSPRYCLQLLTHVKCHRTGFFGCDEHLIIRFDAERDGVFVKVKVMKCHMNVTLVEQLASKIVECPVESYYMKYKAKD